MRAWNEEIKNRVEWIKGILKDAGAKGIVIGMSEVQMAFVTTIKPVN